MAGQHLWPCTRAINAQRGGHTGSQERARRTQRFAAAGIPASSPQRVRPRGPDQEQPILQLVTVTPSSAGSGKCSVQLNGAAQLGKLQALQAVVRHPHRRHRHQRLRRRVCGTCGQQKGFAVGKACSVRSSGLCAVGKVDQVQAVHSACTALCPHRPTTWAVGDQQHRQHRTCIGVGGAFCRRARCPQRLKRALVMLHLQRLKRSTQWRRVQQQLAPKAQPAAARPSAAALWRRSRQQDIQHRGAAAPHLTQHDCAARGAVKLAEHAGLQAGKYKRRGEREGRLRSRAQPTHTGGRFTPL